MRAKAEMLFIIGLLLLTGVATAAMTMTTDRTWLVANNTEYTNITVTVTNATNVPVQNSPVTFSFTGYPPYSANPYNGSMADYGSLTNVTPLTNSNGQVFTAFQDKTKSGTVNLSAITTYQESNGTMISLRATTIVNIDHDRPFIATFSYPSSGTVATQVLFNVSITDKWGNMIDNRNPAQTHTFGLHVDGPSPDDCGFWNGASFVHDLYQNLDAYGNLSVIVKLTSKSGHNNIVSDQMGDNLGSVPMLVNWIDAETWGTPYSISQEIDPQPPEIPADGLPQHIYTIKYTLLDKYGNPSGNQQLWVNTSMPGENQMFTSNSLGQVWVTYGPKSTTGHITINATTVAKTDTNISVNISTVVGFYNTSPTNMDITASPESMPSLDANPAEVGNVIVKITDIMGNPVPGETVTFSLGTPGYDGTYNVTANPKIGPPSTAVTDNNGDAMVNFYPGAFSAIRTDPKWNPQATGNVTVFANWNGNIGTLKLTWKNYPYLSVKTTVNPQTVAVNGSIDVGIQLLGDGWALQPSPLDVVLCTDKSGSMSSDGKLTAAIAADKSFNGQMSSQDRIGLVSFEGSGNATQDLSLTSNRTKVNTTVGNYYTNNGNTPTRSAIYWSVTMLKNSPRNNAIPAIVLLTDGVWNTGGDPEALLTRSSDGNWNGAATAFPGVSSTDSVITYAKNNNIKMYVVGLGPDVDNATLQRYATQTGGVYYADPTSDATKLQQIYTAIAGQLKTAAGVNTQMSLNFGNVSVNGAGISGAQVFNYTYLAYNVADPLNSSTRIGWQNGTINSIDQTGQWKNNQILSFNVGTVNISQQWNASFRLVCNQSGLIDLFGNNSVISFNGGASTLTLPDTYVTVVNTIISSGIHMKTIQLSAYTCTPPVGNLIPCQWVTTYDGTQSVMEQVYYSNDNGLRWIQFDEKDNLLNTGIGGTTTQFSQLDVSSLPPGGYLFKVDALALDAPNTELVSNSVTNAYSGKTFIKLE